MSLFHRWRRRRMRCAVGLKSPNGSRLACAFNVSGLSASDQIGTSVQERRGIGVAPIRLFCCPRTFGSSPYRFLAP